MKLRFLIILNIILLFCITNTIAQNELNLNPNQIRFEDIFNRIDSTYLINIGSSPLTVDSINYNNSFYSVSFDNNLQLPISISPNDSLKMYVFLNGFYYITQSDTSDTLIVFHSGVNNPEYLKINTDFYEDDFGIVAGTVRDSITPLDNASIYFFYDGVFLLDKAVTDASGYYEITLPEGDYIIAAEREGYHVIFKDSTYDPYFARLIDIDDDVTTVVNFYMKKIDDTTKSVSGNVNDSLGGTVLDKGVIVVRKGTHVPSPRPTEKYSQISTDVFSGFIKPDGSYKVHVLDEDFYFIQAYSDYFLPGYYNNAGNASVFWQNADTIVINSNISGKNLFLQKDISYGGGVATGSIVLPNADFWSNDGITIFARSVNSGEYYSYNFGKVNSTFHLNHLPYGVYELVAQKVGLPNAVSQQFTIDSLNPSVSNLSIIFEPSSVLQDNAFLVENFFLQQNYPNPFNPSTRIQWQAYVNSKTTLKVYDILGNEVATLVDAELPAGKYEVDFSANESLSSGVYIYRLQTDEFSASKKMILLR